MEIRKSTDVYRRRLEEPTAIRFFSDEEHRLQKIVIHATDKEGRPKFKNKSHALRCAVMQFILNEEMNLKIRRGRPKKRTGLY